MFDSTAASAGINFSKFEDIDVNVSGTGAVNRRDNHDIAVISYFVLCSPKDMFHFKEHEQFSILE